jgi:hypothetical protein
MMIFFGLLFYKVAAGLCIYFIASSLWGFAERKWLPKKKPQLETADDMLAKMRGEAAAPREEVRPASNGQNVAITPAGNRAKRRQERKRQKEARNAPGRSESVSSEQPRNAPPTPDSGGWWANMRRKVRDWWQDVLKKAAKK